METTTTAAVSMIECITSDRVNRNLEILKDYTTACLAFARETREQGLDWCHSYTTDGDAGWVETCDNAHDGLDVSWAYGLYAKEIRAKAPAYLLAEAQFSCFVQAEYLMPAGGIDLLT
jgi:hypothetical protein